MSMDVFVKIIFFLLLLFVPFAFAGAEPWAFSVLQGGLLVCLTVTLFAHRRWVFSNLTRPVFFTLGFLTLFTLLQTCFPKTLVDAHVYYPVSLMQLFGWEHVSLFVTYLGVVALAGQLFPSKEQVQKLLFGVSICALLVALCAACFTSGGYIFHLTGARAIYSVGPFLNRNHAAVFLAMGALVTLGLFFTGQLRGKQWENPRQKYVFYIQQICLSAVFMGLAVSTVMTRSRGGMLSLLVGLFAYAFLCIWAVEKRFRKRLKGIFITLVVMSLVGGWIYTHVDDINAFAQRATSSSERTRKMLYRSAGRLLNDYPLWGIGVGAMPVAITSYVEWPVNSYIERLHNDWLEILLGVGYMGMLPVIGGLVWFVWLALWRLKQLEIRKQFLFAALLSALLAMSVGSTVDFHFFIPANAFLFFVLLGALCAPTFCAPDSRHVSLSLPIKCISIIIFCAALYIPACKTAAWRNMVFGAGLKTHAKLARYEQAVKQYPSAYYAVRLGNAYFNAAVRADTPQEREQFLQQALDLCVAFLSKYPREKALSQLYVRVRNAWQSGQSTSDLVK